MPSNFDLGSNSIDVYVYKGSGALEKVDFECDCLFKVQDLDWISYDNSTNTITVQTSDDAYVGEHRILAVQSFENYDGIYPFTEFSLQIKNKQFQSALPPYFDPDVETNL